MLVLQEIKDKAPVGIEIPHPQEHVPQSARVVSATEDLTATK
jgi:hypothetical protein